MHIQNSPIKSEGNSDAAMLVAKAASVKYHPSTCYFCNVKGHKKSECPEKLKWKKWNKKTATIVGEDSDNNESLGAS